MKIIIFGTGRYYQRYKLEIEKKSEVIALIDNNPKLWGTFLDNHLIYNPKEIHTLDYDKIVLLSAKAYEMKEQLLELGISEEHVLYKEEYWKEIFGLDIQCYNSIESDKRKILLVSHELNYDGGSLVIKNTAILLQEMGYKADLLVPEINGRLLNELKETEIEVMICPALPFVKAEELGWIDDYEVVIVNAFPMLRCAIEISKIKPTLWWIHECDDRYSNVYTKTKKMNPDYDDLKKLENIQIYVVSEIAQRAFNVHYKNRIEGILPFGIPDEYISTEKKDKKKRIFAIIGGICELKGQSQIFEVIDKLSNEELDKVEFWFIGKKDIDSSSKSITSRATHIPQIKICGEFTREEMKEAFKQIDGVICTSLEETMSIAIIEGMMNKKICITSNNTGVAEYIEDGVNGFVYERNDIDTLSEKIRIVLNDEQNKMMCENARKTYEEYFFMKKFTGRLKRAIESTIEAWEC